MNLVEKSNEGPLELWKAISLLIPLCTLSLWITLSNLFVMLSVFGFRSMRTPSNVYLASLALTDFLVGCLILPLNIIQIIYNRWIFSQEICKTWLTLDVTLSTLSILHLIAIAVDRYRVVNDGIQYLQNRLISDVISVIICLWCLSLWIATPPILGWGSWLKIEGKGSEGIYTCDYSSTLGYVLHSAFGSFIFPIIMMINLYIKIYRKIQQRVRERSTPPSLHSSVERELSETETSSVGVYLKKKRQSIKSRLTLKIFGGQKKIRFSLTKEKRAAQTLGIIIGAFLICWVPFCLMYILRPIFGEPPVLVYHLLTWLGYSNSAVNPVVYCIYNKDFRQIFYRFFCKCKQNTGPVTGPTIQHV